MEKLQALLMKSSRRQLPSLTALRAFEVSGRRSSFRAAAEELGVTQGAVAQQVRQLEQHLGLTLFTRLPRGLALTRHGQIYLAELSRAFDLMTDATERLLTQPNGVTISVTPTFAAKLLIPALADFRQAFPQVELRTVATEAVADLDREQVDMAVRMPGAEASSGLESKRLFRQELVAVASPHLIRGHRLPIAVRSLSRWPLLHDAHGRWPQFLECDAPVAGAEFSQTTLALDAALSGQGIALACRAFVAADIDAGRLIQVSRKTLVVAPDYYLVRKRVTGREAVADAVWAWCIDRFADEE